MEMAVAWKVFGQKEFDMVKMWNDKFRNQKCSWGEHKSPNIMVIYPIFLLHFLKTTHFNLMAGEEKLGVTSN